MIGSTFALFTSQAQASVSVTSGKVKISAQLDELKLYSANAVELATYNAAEANDKAGQITEGNYAGNYLFALQNGQFANGGTAVLDNNVLTLDNVTPGDKVTLNLVITNESNVNIKYRVRLVGTSSADSAVLLSAMKVKVGTVELTSNQYQSEWLPLALVSPNPMQLSVELPLSVDSNEVDNFSYENKTVSFAIVVEAVQGNAATN